MDNVLLVPDAQDAQGCTQTGAVIWNYFIAIITKLCVKSNPGCAKNVTCTFWYTTFTGCCSSQEFAHILG